MKDINVYAKRYADKYANKYAKRYISGILLAVIFAVVAVYATKREVSAAEPGPLSVSGVNLVDGSGKTVQLKGISTHGLSWFPEYVNEKSFSYMKEKWGINVVRLAMYTAEYNGYCTGDAENKKKLEKLIDDGVNYASEAGLYVIIDWHILSDGSPATHQKEALSFFKKMAKKYKDNTNVLYEICNEPNGGVQWKDIKKYALKAIKKIRKYDKDAVIITGTPTWSQDVDIAAADKIASKYGNIMYSLHFYAATHGEFLRQKAKKAIDSGLPVFVTEFGICDSSGNGGIDKKEAKKWFNFLNDNKISYVAWNLSNKNETSAFIKPGCSKVSGWKKSELTASAKYIIKYFK